MGPAYQCPFIHCLTPVYIRQHALLARCLLMLCYLMFCKYELPATINVYVNLLVVTTSSICWVCCWSNWHHKLLKCVSTSSKLSSSFTSVSMKNHSVQFKLIQSTTLAKVRSISCSLWRVAFKILEMSLDAGIKCIT